MLLITVVAATLVTLGIGISVLGRRRKLPRFLRSEPHRGPRSPAYFFVLTLLLPVFYVLIGVSNSSERHARWEWYAAYGLALLPGFAVLTANFIYERRLQRRGEPWCVWEAPPAGTEEQPPFGRSGGFPGPLGLWRPR